MKTLSIAVALSLLLSGCGDKSPAPEQVKVPQVVSTSVSGVVDAASAYDVTVNGKTYVTQHAEVYYEGGDYNISSVKVGMNVNLLLQDNKVTEVDLDPAFSGLAVLNPDNQLVMNGIKLSISDPQVFNLDYKHGGGDLGWVLVFAHLNGNAQWVVTNVSPVNAMPSSEIEGKVSDLTASSFMLGTAKIAYAPLTVTAGKPLTNGMYVQVIGNFINDQLTAKRIDIK
ncbi:DUF5666 domain-containing protein [Photobacterium nomapromontoriensis]|uniref:DUF5666 domain-containing protein n=1 Tax=Photobacterium nomapromontoriensis TaxID=2910237 RepID=UPI003D0F7A6F